MTQFEKAEIRRLPKKYRPMGAWGYFWHMLLYSIPLIGQICLIWGAVNDRNISRRSFARITLVLFIIEIAIVALAYFGVIPVDAIEGAIGDITSKLPSDI